MEKYICIHLILSLAQQSVCFYYTNFYSGIKYYTISHMIEQCDSRWVTENTEGLSEDIDRHVFGQDLAVDVILGALEGHTKNEHKRKPLVLNFHGWTGSGKGYVADFIVKNWFKQGEKSDFVKIYHAKKHFPLQKDAYLYQRTLQDELESTIKKCSKSVFVFDEVDKYPRYVLDGIKPYLDYNTQVNGLDFRESIFVFITNSGDDLINKIAYESFQKGVPREELEMKDFEEHLKYISFNEEGGFFQSDLIKHHLIDHVVPFLPLERKHVKSCIEAELKLREADFDDFEMIISEIMEELMFGPGRPLVDIFSTSGCKHVSHKVSSKMYREKRRKRRQTEF